MRKTLLALLLLSLGCAISYAGSGKAIVPVVIYNRTSSTDFVTTTIYLTNLTNHPIKVSVVYYGKTGNIISQSFVRYDYWTNSNTEIAANSSATINLETNSLSPGDFGKAIIYWQNVDSGYDDTVALVAHGWFNRYHSGTDGRVAIPINNGMPF